MGPVSEVDLGEGEAGDEADEGGRRECEGIGE